MKTKKKKEKRSVQEDETQNTFSNTAAKPVIIMQFGPEVIFFFMLTSAEHEMYPAYKCLNAN